MLPAPDPNSRLLLGRIPLLDRWSTHLHRFRSFPVTISGRFGAVCRVHRRLGLQSSFPGTARRLPSHRELGHVGITDRVMPAY